MDTTNLELRNDIPIPLQLRYPHIVRLLETDTRDPLEIRIEPDPLVRRAVHTLLVLLCPISDHPIRSPRLILPFLQLKARVDQLERFGRFGVSCLCCGRGGLSSEIALGVPPNSLVFRVEEDFVLFRRGPDVEDVFVGRAVCFVDPESERALQDGPYVTRRGKRRI